LTTTKAARNTSAARIEDYVSRVVSEAPPLTEEQINRVAVLLRGGAA